MSTILYLRSSTNEVGAGGSIRDLSETQGSDGTATSDANTDGSFITTARWRKTINTEINATAPTSLNITGIQGSTEYRWRINRLNSSGGLVASSSWSATGTSTGVVTRTITDAPSGVEYAMIEIEFQSRRDGGMPSNNSVTIAVSDANSFIEPTYVAGPDPVTEAPTLSLDGSITSDSIPVAWTAVDHADEYEVQVDNVTVDTVAGTSLNITGLDPETQYDIRVRGINPASDGPWSNVLTETTLQANVTAAPTLSLDGTPTTTSIPIQWTSVAHADQYEIEIDEILHDTVSGTSANLTGLDPDTQYDIRVRGINSVSDGPWSNVLQASTALPAPTDAPVLSLDGSLTHNSIPIQWTAVTHAAEYEVQLDQVTVETTSDLSTVLAGLDPETEYSIRVRGINATGQGPWSNVVTETTGAAPPPPEGAHIAQRGAVWSDGTSTSTLVVPLDSPGEIGVGNGLTIRVVGTGDRTINSVTDPRGNTWQWYKSPIAATTHVAWLLVCLDVETAYQANDDITITLNSTTHWAAVVDEWVPLDAVDQTSVASDSGVQEPSFDSGATAATNGLSRIEVGWVAAHGTPITTTPEALTPPWEALGTAVSEEFARTIYGHWRQVGGSDPAQYQGTFASNRGWTAGVAAITLDTQEPAFVEDNFDGSTLGAHWDEVIPLAGPTIGVENGRAVIEVPSGTTYDLWVDSLGRDAPRIMQDCLDQDFDIVTRFDSVPPLVGNNGFAIVVEQSENTIVRADIWSDGVDHRIFAGTVENGTTGEVKLMEEWENLAPAPGYGYGPGGHMHLQRRGDEWTLFVSYNGFDWIQVAQWIFAIEVTRVGLAAHSSDNNPGNIGRFAYFKSERPTSSDLKPEVTRTTALNQSFTGSNGSPWPSGWTADNYGNASVEQQDGMGVLEFDGADRAGARVAHEINGADVGIHFVFEFPSSNEDENGWFVPALRAADQWGDYYAAEYGYGLELNHRRQDVRLFRVWDAPTTDLANPTSDLDIAYTQVGTTKSLNLMDTGTLIHCRFEASGDTLRARFWVDGTSEPETWLYEVFDGVIDTGHVGFAYGRGWTTGEAFTGTNEVHIETVEIYGPGLVEKDALTPKVGVFKVKHGVLRTKA